MSFETVTFDLSFDKARIGETGNLTANYYTLEGVNGVDGKPRPLSIGQLVMALCLDRATRLEAEIIDIVEKLNKTSEDLERMTKIESDIVNATEGTPVNLKNTKFDDTGMSYYDFLTLPEEAASEGDPVGMGIANVPDSADYASEELITEIESKMDSLNSFSQQTMIDLQALTAKRDQSYDMISNILKSLNTTLLTNVNNL